MMMTRYQITQRRGRRSETEVFTAVRCTDGVYFGSREYCGFKNQRGDKLVSAAAVKMEETKKKKKKKKERKERKEMDQSSPSELSVSSQRSEDECLSTSRVPVKRDRSKERLPNFSNKSVDHGGIHRMKPGFKKYPCEPTLDPNTAHKNLLLSEDNRKVTWVEEAMSYPDHQERFDHFQQVLCEQGLDKRCYWEMEVEEPFIIGVTYKTIGRKGDLDDCKLGNNSKSWSFGCTNDGCYVRHNNKSISVSSLCSRSSRVGVYLDWPAAILSFYRVSSDSRAHVHTFKVLGKFSAPVYPAVKLHSGSSVLFCQPT